MHNHIEDIRLKQLEFDKLFYLTRKLAIELSYLMSEAKANDMKGKIDELKRIVAQP